jgi:hypothetical protein
MDVFEKRVGMTVIAYMIIPFILIFFARDWEYTKVIMLIWAIVGGIVFWWGALGTKGLAIAVFIGLAYYFFFSDGVSCPL